MTKELINPCEDCEDMDSGERCQNHCKRQREYQINIAIATRDKEWKQEYGKLVEQSRKELADCNAEWVEWVGENIIELVLNFQMTESNKQNLLHMWQNHKRGIGL